MPPPGAPSLEPLADVALAAGAAAGLLDSAVGAGGPSEGVPSAPADDDAGDDEAAEDSPAGRPDPVLDGSPEVELVADCAVDCSALAEDTALLAAGEEPVPGASPDPADGA